VLCHSKLVSLWSVMEKHTRISRRNSQKTHPAKPLDAQPSASLLFSRHTARGLARMVGRADARE
jgi:hypothetical protein